MENRLQSRPFAVADLDLLFDWFNSDAAFGSFDGPGDGFTRDELELRIAHGALHGSEIWRIDDTDFAWTSIYHDLQAPWIATLTIIIARPEFRGRGLGTEIHRALVRQIRENTDLEKIEVWTDEQNRVEQRVLEKLGFRLEGAFQRKWRLRGEYRDMRAYGLLRESFGEEKS